ncbi:uncharacterized protein JN550_004675 [Neoarthrinium moseri]|uniref:uncharacterized protein n=1 Tax=Neoarthrinium moseri TaxID=1658444 RepID=UPI001FDACC8A|nr:uncharacterized protein JN550_004675 [Neoarthrinium moseri]KAI1871230.1 hypothetical protein JN550_004675 [Neoarthrinium moseri]
MKTTYQHRALNSTVKGLVEQESGLVKFLGVPYGTVSERFARPQPIESWQTSLDCTRHGPRCPQTVVDVGHLLRIPLDQSLPVEHEDEFRCLNLDVVLPKESLAQHAKDLPVLAWIHGGSQANTFGSAASGVCDMTTIVKHAVAVEKPIIAVSIQYRLNIFAFGDSSTMANLALEDQALALRWIQKHIKDFGGDPERVTLAGESAGAVYTHAHVAINSPLSQAILSSGSLHLSPPQPPEKAAAMHDLVFKHLQGSSDHTLKTVPVSELVEAVEKSGIKSWFLKMEPPFKNWRSNTGCAQRILISDAVIWREGIWAMKGDAITAAFDMAGEHSHELKRMYAIYPERPSSCKIGALDFINDWKFLLPAESIAQQWREQGKAAFRCLIDERNPWQPSNGAHHAVDLVLLFGGFDLSFSPGAQHVAETMRTRWIDFIHSGDPWSPKSYFAFGPYGRCEELPRNGFSLRRRARQLEYLATVDPSLLDKVLVTLAAGRISLNN